MLLSHPTEPTLLMAEVPRRASCSFPSAGTWSDLPETLLLQSSRFPQQHRANSAPSCRTPCTSLGGQGPISQPLPEALDGALPADGALGLVLHLLSHGHPVQHSQPHHGLRLQVGPLQELGRLDGRLPVALGRGEEGAAQSWDPAVMDCKLLITSRSLSPAQLLQRGWHRPRHPTHKAEAAPDAGLHIAAPERRHLPQLARDLDGLVEQDAKVPLVTQSPGVRHLAEEICQQDRHIAPLEIWLMLSIHQAGHKHRGAVRGSDQGPHCLSPAGSSNKREKLSYD